MSNYHDRYILKLKHYPNCIQYSYYPKFCKSFSSSSSPDEIHRCSLSRSYSLIRDYILCNNWDYFFTLTLKSQLYTDVSSAFNIFHSSLLKYSKLCKKRNIDFSYIVVYELTKKGNLHCHGFGKGFYDLYENNYNHLSSLFFDNLGFHNFTKADIVNPFYLIKYIQKQDIDVIPRKFYRSRNLRKPDVSYLADDFLQFANLPFTFENSFCKMLTVAN